CPPLLSPLPYTTLFRSRRGAPAALLPHPQTMNEAPRKVARACAPDVPVPSVPHSVSKVPQLLGRAKRVSLYFGSRTDSRSPSPRSEEHTSELQSRENLV